MKKYDFDQVRNTVDVRKILKKIKRNAIETQSEIKKIEAAEMLQLLLTVQTVKH